MNKINCPSCAARYNVPDEKLGKTVKCAKCGERFELAAPLELEEFAFPDLPAAAPVAPLPPLEQIEAQNARIAKRSAAGDASPVGGLNAYFRDVFGFFRMLAHPSDAGTLIAVCVVCLLQIPVRFALCVGGMGSAVIRGWFLSFLLRTVQNGAARENSLPDFSVAEGMMEDVVKPSLSFIAVRLVASLPLIGTLIYAARDGRIDTEIAILFGVSGIFAPELALLGAVSLSDQVDGLLAVVALPLLIGMAATPMLLLVMALEGIESLIRFDLMAITIARTLPGYFATTVIYFLAILLPVGIAYSIQNALFDDTSSTRSAPSTVVVTTPGSPTSTTADPNAASDPNAALSAARPGGAPQTKSVDLTKNFFGSMAGEAVALLINVFTSVFAMRAIGLYYAHFKRGFAFAWG